MSKTKKVQIFLFAFMLVTSNFLHAEEVVSNQSPISYILDKMDFVTYFTKPIKQNLAQRGIDLDFFGGVIQGVDNNIFLDPSRTRDAFLQTSTSGDLTYHFTDDLRGTLDADITNIIYYRFNDNNLLDISGNPGLEVDFIKDYFTLEFDYLFDWLFSPFDEDGSYITNRYSVFLRHNACEQLYHRGGFRLEYKRFTDRKAFGSNRVKKSALRSDVRYTGEHETILYLGDNIKLRENIQLYRNDSNDQFFDYYDYFAFRSKTSAVAIFTEKLYSILSFTYTRKNYDDRLSSQNNTHQKDNLYVFNISLLYDLTPSFTLTTGYSYRENNSNEPLEKYSGSIFTVGLYYTF